MRVVAFAPALSAVDGEGGGLEVRGLPMTSAFLDVFPTDITISLVVVVCAPAGEEYDPVRYIVATSPSGEPISTMQFGWHWEDDPQSPVKFRVFAQYLPMRVESAGVYTIGLYDSPDATETKHLFPLPVFLNPTAVGS